MQLFERERFPRFHIGESLIPETYWVLKRLNMLPKMQAEPLRQEVQRAVRQRRRQAVGAVLLLGQQAARVLADVAGGAQRVRPDDAEQRARARRRRARRRARRRGAVRGRPRGRRHRSVRRTAPIGEVRAKVVVDASGQNGLLQNKLRLQGLGPGAQQGRHLDLLGRRLSRHRPRRRRDDGAPDRRSTGLVLVHPAARRHRQRRRRRARSTTLFKGRGPYAQTYEEEVERCPAVKQRVRSAKRVTGYFATKDYSYRSTQVAGDGWVLVGDAFAFLDPLYSSGVLLALRSGEMAADAIVEGLARGDTSGSAARQVGTRLQRGRGPHAAARVRVLRRLQLRRRSSGTIRTCAAR